MKESIKALKKVFNNKCMVAFALMLVVVIVLCIDIDVRAAEVSAYEFSYNYTNTVISETDKYFGCSQTFNGILRIIPEDGYTYAIIRYGDGNPYYNYACYKRRSGSIVNEYANGTISVTLQDVDGLVKIDSFNFHQVSLPLDLYKDNMWSYGPGSYSTNLPVFESSEDLNYYFETGDDSGRINKPLFDIEETSTDYSFTLKDFHADNIINASWSGTTQSSYVTDESFVLVRFCYYDAGLMDYSYKFPLSDGCFNIPWEEIQIEGDAVKRMDVLPVGAPADSVFGSYVKGSVSSIYFSSSGSVTDSFTDVTSDNGTLIEEIPTPQITVDSIGYSFGFNNASDNYYFEMKGRWYSVEDIELYRDDLMWKYKYSSIIKSDLTSWVLAGNFKKASGTYTLDELGKVAFNSFLSVHPVDDRNYYGGTNAVGNFFLGYNDALETIKMLLKQPTSIYNGVEIYVRYFTYDDAGNIHYGKWCHWYDAMANPDGSSGSQWDDKDNMFTESQSETGLTPEQMEDLENTGNSKSDVDAVTSYINGTSTEIATQKIWDVMESMVASMGAFPNLVATVFGWLPSWLINMIAASIGCLILLRFVGR